MDEKITVLKNYDVFVGRGIIKKIPKLINDKGYSKIFVITTPVIDKFCFGKLTSQVGSLKKIIINVDESTKNINSVQAIWEKLFTFGCDRRSIIIILGGGVLGDVAGFAASTFMRGIPFIHIPTTLLSQVDSSVGGKNGINFMNIKNLIGSFSQPLAVFCDTDFLLTLPNREFIEGFGEIIKHGIIAEKKYFNFVSSKKPKEFTNQEISQIILESIKIKAEIVNRDEKESDLRKLLNFGHTIGHAIEALTQKSNKPLLHGEAVSIGIIIEAKISKILGLISDREVNEIKKVLDNAGLPTELPKLSSKDLIKKIKADKKNEAGKIKFTLIKGIGIGVVNQNVDEKIIKNVLGETV